MFDEAGQQITDLPKDGLKKFVHSPAVYQDEIYFFRRLINPTKVSNALLSIINWGSLRAICQQSALACFFHEFYFCRIVIIVFGVTST